MVVCRYDAILLSFFVALMLFFVSLFQILTFLLIIVQTGKSDPLNVFI